MHRTRTAILAAIALTACTAAGDGLGELVRDAGRLLEDAGEAMLDAGPGKAQAASDGHVSMACIDGGEDGGGSPLTVLEADCVPTTRTVTTANVTQESTWWYATFQVDTSDIAGVDSVVCGHQDYASLPACPDGATCTGDTVPSMDCATGGAEFQNGTLRVSCGFTIKQTSSGTVTTSGQHYSKARITVR